MVIGNQNGKTDRLLSMGRDLLPERFAFWQGLKKRNPKWRLESFTGGEGSKEEL